MFAVAAQRCAEVFDPPDAATIWRLPDDVEEAFDARCEGWLAAESWAPYFESVAALADFDVAKVPKCFLLVDDAEIEASAKLKAADGGKGVLVPGPFEPGRRSVALLALGFGRGAPRDLLVPYSPARKA